MVEEKQGPDFYDDPGVFEMYLRAEKADSPDVVLLRPPTRG